MSPSFAMFECSEQDTLWSTCYSDDKMIHSKLPNNVFIFHLGNLFMILTALRLDWYFFLRNINWIGESRKKMERTLKIALKSPKSPYFFQFLEKKSFLNRTLGLENLS